MTLTISEGHNNARKVKLNAFVFLLKKELVVIQMTSYFVMVFVDKVIDFFFLNESFTYMWEIFGAFSGVHVATMMTLVLAVSLRLNNRYL